MTPAIRSAVSAGAFSDLAFRTSTVKEIVYNSIPSGDVSSVRSWVRQSRIDHLVYAVACGEYYGKTKP